MNNIVRNDLVPETGKKPGYKKTKLGWIPEEWEVVKLGDIGKLTSGTTPHRAKHERYFKNGSIKWVKTTDLNNGIITKTEENVTHVALDETSLKVLPKNTLLIAMYGGFNQIGRTGLLKIDATINQALSALIINKNDIDPIFLLNWLNHKVGLWRRFAASSRKDPNITKNDVKHFPFFKPPFPEQQKIATILSTWDKAIELTQQLIEAKEEQKKGLMQQLLTGKVRVKGYYEEWKEVRLGDIFKERNQKGYSDLELLSIGAKGVYPQSESNKKDSSNSDKSKYKRICPGDIGYNTMRMWQGRSAVSELEGIVSPAYTIVIPKKGIDVNFMGSLFQLPKTIDKFWRYSQGLVGDTLNCKFKNFALVKIKIPPTIGDQKEISRILKTADKEIETLNKKLELLYMQKKGLMQRLLVGEIRVNTNE